MVQQDAAYDVGIPQWIYEMLFGSYIMTSENIYISRATASTVDAFWLPVLKIDVARGFSIVGGN